MPQRHSIAAKEGMWIRWPEPQQLIGSWKRIERGFRSHRYLSLIPG